MEFWKGIMYCLRYKDILYGSRIKSLICLIAFCGGIPLALFYSGESRPNMLMNFQYYDFITDFNVKDNSNDKIVPSGEKEITAVLDGQQRLTALLIGLRGSYTYKTPYLRQDHPQAYQKRGTLP